MTTETETTPFELEALKVTYNLCMSKMKQLMTPQIEVVQLTEALRHASETNRMGTDADFAEFVNADLAISIMQKLAKTISMDEAVSIYLNDDLVRPTALTMFCLCCVVHRSCGRYDGGLCRIVCYRAC